MKLFTYIEIVYYSILLKFWRSQNEKIIPKGHYCYEILQHCDNHLKTKPCKYFRYLGAQHGGCTFLGVYEWDVCLADQCKVCNINE